MSPKLKVGDKVRWKEEEQNEYEIIPDPEMIMGELIRHWKWLVPNKGNWVWIRRNKDGFKCIVNTRLLTKIR